MVDIRVFGVGSTDNAREELDKCGIKGMISGILLNEGRLRNFDVYAMVLKSPPGLPDARATARIIETMIRLAPSINVDIAPLYEGAEKAEGFVRKLRKQAKSGTGPVHPHSMYQ